MSQKMALRVSGPINFPEKMIEPGPFYQYFDSEVVGLGYLLQHDQRKESGIETELSVRKATAGTGKEEKEGGKGAEKSSHD
jgi:hypothetical protein